MFQGSMARRDVAAREASSLAVMAGGRSAAPATSSDGSAEREEGGFILTPTYRLAGGKPEVHLYGVLEGGEPVLIIDDRFTPYFFVRASDASAVRKLAGTRVTPVDLRTLAGEPVVRVDAVVPRDVAR